MEQPDTIELEVKKEPFDFMNWRYDGAQLIHDPENAPQPEPTPPTDIDLLQVENKELKKQVSELTDSMLFLSEQVLGGAE